MENRDLINGQVAKPDFDFRLDVVASAWEKFNCNFRCSYCHKDYFIQSIPPNSTKKTFKDAIELCRKFMKGSFSIHLAGSGEPLLIPQKKLEKIIEPLKGMNDLNLISITTNGYFLEDRINEIISLGIKDINVSLPSLNPEQYTKIMNIDLKKAEDIIKRIERGIHAAKSKGFNVDINVCISYDIEEHIEDFIKFSEENQVRMKFFPIISVPRLNISAQSSYFSDFIKILSKRKIPEIEAIGRYLTISWNFGMGLLSAKPGDKYMRPIQCLQCTDFHLCEESCWRSIRISPWYIQVCGVRTDNVYWFQQEDPKALRNCLISGGKLPGPHYSHSEFTQLLLELKPELGNHPFIVIEGPDGSGKTTFSKLIAQKLGYLQYRTPPNIFQNGDVKKALEKAGTEVARNLYYLSAMYYANLEVRSLIAFDGIVCDRWMLSTELYHEVLLDSNNINLPEELEKELIKPDLTIILDVSTNTLSKRIAVRPIQFDNRWEVEGNLRDTIQHRYKNLKGEKIVHISNDGTIQKTLRACLDAIKKYKLDQK